MIIPACLAIFGIYLITIAPGIFWRDSAEFVMIPFNLDIGHPAGSPTFTMFAGLLARLPIGSIAFRSNLASALLGATAFLFFVLAARAIAKKVAPQLDDSILVALSAASVAPLVFSPGIWYWTVTAEVYSGMLCTLALAITISVSESRPDRPTRLPYLLSIGLLLGLGCGLHMVIILYVPAFGIYLFLTRKSDFSILKIALFSIFFLLGFSIFLLLPIRSAANPPFDYGNTETLGALLAHITGRYYSEVLSSFPWHRIVENILILPRHIVSHLSLAHAILAIAGLTVLLLKSWRTALLIMVIAAGHFYLYIRDWKVDFGYLTIYLLCSLLACAALVKITELIIKRHPKGRNPLVAVFTAAAVLGASWQVAANYDYCNREGHDLLLRQTRKILDSVPYDSLLVSNEDNINYATVYTQSIERWREDVLHFHRAYLTSPGYLHTRFNDLDTKSLTGQPFGVQQFFKDNAIGHQAFWDYGWEPENWLHQEKLKPYGRLMQVQDHPVDDMEKAAADSMKIWNETLQPIVSDPLFNQNDWTVMDVTARFWSGRAKFYFDQGYPDISKKALKKAMDIRPDFAAYYAQLAALHSFDGQNEKAIQAVLHGLELDPLNTDLWNTHGQLMRMAKDIKSAIESYSRSLKINKAQAPIALFLSKSYYANKQYADAEQAALKGLVYSRNPDMIARLNEMAALSLIRQNRFAQAKKYLLDMAAEKPANSRIKKLIALCDENLSKP